MSTKAIKITGWVLTAAVGSLFLMSAFMKLSQNPEVVSQAAGIGIDAASYRMIGVVEIISLILFIIPRTGVVGTLLLAAYMGGAIATHLEHQQSITMAVVIAAVVWITAFLRFEELSQRILGRRKPVMITKNA
jgi:hypothetical protein